MYLAARTRWLRGALAALLLLAVGLADAEDCGYPNDSPGRFGPLDFRDPTLDKERYMVEGAHFTPYMEEMALYGFSSRRASTQEAEGQGLIGGNLDYTIYAFPNHARALHAMGVWQLRIRQQSAMNYERMLQTSRLRTPECYFERGIMFRPDDGMVRLAYGAFLHKAGDLRNAATQYQKAIELMPNMPEPHYNLGLLYVDLGNYTKAREEANIAYGLGYPLQGLKNKLARAQSGPQGSAATEKATDPAQ